MNAKIAHAEQTAHIATTCEFLIQAAATLMSNHLPAHHQWLQMHHQHISGNRVRNPLAGASPARNLSWSGRCLSAQELKASNLKAKANAACLPPDESPLHRKPPAASSLALHTPLYSHRCWEKKVSLLNCNRVHWQIVQQSITRLSLWTVCKPKFIQHKLSMLKFS